MEIPIELSVVMPCLNEEETVGVCVRKAVETLRKTGIQGEIIVADNGSTDGSVEATRAECARVINVKAKQRTTFVPWAIVMKDRLNEYDRICRGLH
jgi:glycosyltransferase involved in cell wall biosynthesis